MSTTVDERVVEMRFDNKQFEQNIQTSLSSIDKLKRSLNLEGAAKGLETVNDAAQKCNMSPLTNAVETVRVRFSALEVMAITALQNITLAGELLAKEKPEYKANRKAIHAELEEKARTLLAQMGLSERENHYPHQLSGGQQQRVAIARALALEPDILCFDEPTSALDPELTGEVLRVLRDLADQKTTMIIVTHEMSFARDVADRILFMDGGVVVEEGPAHQVIEHPHEERTKQFLSHYGT